MATRERRLSQFDGNGEPPPGQAVEVLCEDHSGTYQLPFPCLYVDGKWHNQESGGLLEATVVAWRFPRLRSEMRNARTDRTGVAFAATRAPSY